MPNDFFDSQNEEDLQEDGFSSVKPFGTEESKKKSSGKLDWSKIDWTQADLPVQPPTDTFREYFKTADGKYLPVEETISYVSPIEKPFSTISTTEEDRRKKGVTYRRTPEGKFEPVPMDLALRNVATGAKWAGYLTANPLLAGAGSLAERATEGDLLDKTPKEMLGVVASVGADALVGSKFGTGAVIPQLKTIKGALDIGKGAALAKVAAGATEGALAGTAYTLLKSVENPDELNSIGTNAALFGLGGAIGGGLIARSDIKSIDKELASNLRNLELKGNEKQVTIAKQLLASNTDDALRIAESTSEEVLPFKQQFVDALKQRKLKGGLSSMPDQRGFAKQDLMENIGKTVVSAGSGITVGVKSYKELEKEQDPNALKKSIMRGLGTGVGVYAGASYLPKVMSNPKKLIGDVIGPEIYIGREFTMEKYISESSAAAWKNKASNWGKEIDGWISSQPNKSLASESFNKVWKADPNERIAMSEWQNMPENLQRIIAESSLDARKFSIDIASFVPSEMSKKILSNVGQYTTIPYRLHASDDLRELWMKSPEFQKAKSEYRDELINVSKKTEAQADEIINRMVNDKDELFGINKNSTGSSVTDILTSRSNLTPKAKAMLGEIVEPGSVIAATIGKQADLVYANQWEKAWSQMLVNSGLATREAKEGLVRLIDDAPFKTSTLVHKNFDGLWVEPHILESLQELRSNNIFGFLGDNPVTRGTLGAIGVSKATKTIGNFAYNFMPQLLSNTIMVASAGSVNLRGILKGGTRSLAIQAWDSPFTKLVVEGGRKVLKIDQSFLEKSLFDAQRFGILEGNITVADMMTDLQFAFGKGDVLGKGTKAVIDTSSDIFSFPDRLLRQVTWESNIGQIKNIDPRFNGIDLKSYLMKDAKLQNAEADDIVSLVNKLKNNGMNEADVLAELNRKGINTTPLKDSKEFSMMFNDELVKREAAIVTHNEFPNPVMVPRRLRQLSAASAPIPGVGFASPFIMIPVETTRNMWNQTVRGSKLLAEGLKTNNLKMAAAGSKKLASLAGITALGYSGLKYANFDKFGMGDREEGILNEVVLDFDKDKPLLWTTIDPKTKQARYVASDLIFPYNNQAKVAGDVLNFFMTGNDRYIKSAKDTFLGMFGNDEFSNTVLRPAIEAFMDENLRTGNPISSKSGKEGQQEMLDYFLSSSFMPGIIRTIDDVVKAKKGVTDPFTGREYNLKDVLYRVLGFRETSIKLDTQFGNQIDKINVDIEKEKTGVANILYKIPDMELTKMSPDEALAALDKVRTDSESRSNELVSNLSNFVNKMKSLTIAEEGKDGKRSMVRVFTDKDIVDILEQKSVSKPIITQVLLGEPVKPVTIFGLLNTTYDRLMKELVSTVNTADESSVGDELSKKIISYGPFANFGYQYGDKTMSLSKISKEYNDINDSITNKFLEKDSPTKKDELLELINQRNIMITVLEQSAKNHIEEYYKNPEYKNKVDAYNFEYFSDKVWKSKNVKERFEK